MFRRLARVWQHTLTILKALPHPQQRALLRQMIQFSRSLSTRFTQPLPQMMGQLTPSLQPQPPLQPDEIRQLADAVAAWHWHSPLGICLRRSLLRYYFLREAGVPVTIVFGARFKGEQEGGGIGGHAWLTLNGSPYWETPKDYEGFVEMYVYPDPKSETPN